MDADEADAVIADLTAERDDAERRLEEETKLRRQEQVIAAERAFEIERLRAAGFAFLAQIERNGPHGQYVKEFRAALDGKQVVR